MERKTETIIINNTLVPIISNETSTPIFGGKELCSSLGYLDYKNALFNYVEPNDKTTLAEFKKVVPATSDAFLKEYSYYERKAVYVTEQGAYDLLNSCNLPTKHEIKKSLDEFFLQKKFKKFLHHFLNIF